MADFQPVLPEKFSASDIENVCRICLFPNRILYSIFENKVDILISAFTTNKVDQNDGYPHQICAKCYKDIKTAYYFKKQCEYAHNFVKSILKLPPSKKSIICNICTTNFCSNSNLKRHLKNLHGLDWEIGMSRPDLTIAYKNCVSSISFKEENNFECTCESCGEKFENENYYNNHVCPDNEQDDMLFVDPTDEVIIKKGLKKSNSSTPTNILDLKENNVEFSSNTPIHKNLEKENFRNSNSNTPNIITETKENKENYSDPPTRAPTLKELIIVNSKVEEDKIEILNYLDLMPEEKRGEYGDLVEQKKAERRKAYQILKKVSKNITQSLIRAKKNSTLSNDEKFECDECKKCFNRIDILQRHQLCHSNELKLFSCGICLKLFSEVDYLKCHITNIHPNTRIEKPFRCTLCRKLLSRASDISRHIKICIGTNSNQTLFNTTHSEKTQQNEFKISKNDIKKEMSNFDDKSNIYGQKITNKFDFNEPDNDSGTNFDQQGYNDESSYEPTQYDDSTINEESNYSQEKMFNSNFFNDSSNQSFNMKNPKDMLLFLLSLYPGANSELMAKKMEAMQRNENGKFECELCQKEFNRKAHVQRHYLTHTTSKPFACKFCNSKFSCPEYVQTHMNRVHTSKIYKKIKISTVENKTIKSEIQDYECYESTEFSKTSNFHRHQSNNPINSQHAIRHKTEIQKHQKKFNSKYEILKTHDGKFECRICHKVFNRAEHVRRHELTHSDSPRPYKCKYCSKEFSRSDNLKKHLERCVVRDSVENSGYMPIPTSIYKSN